MSSNEVYFLCLVIGTFVAFGLGLAISTVHDRAWARRQQAERARR